MLQIWQWNRQLVSQWELIQHHFGQIFFYRSICDIYPKQLGLKIKHQGSLYYVVEPLYISYWIKKILSFFSCKEDSYRKQYSSKYYYSAIKSEFLRIAYSTLRLNDFISKVKELLEHIKQQGFKRGTTGTSLRKITFSSAK